MGFDSFFYLLNILTISYAVFDWIILITRKSIFNHGKVTAIKLYGPTVIYSVFVIILFFFTRYLYKKSINHPFFNSNKPNKFLKSLIFLLVTPIILLLVINILRVKVLKPFCPDFSVIGIYSSNNNCYDFGKEKYYIKDRKPKSFSKYNKF